MINKTYYGIIAFFILLFVSKSDAQQVGDYGSVASGNWSDLNNWVMCETNGDWSDASPAASLPTTTTKVHIRDGHTVTIDQNVSIAQLYVGEGTSGILTFDAVSGRSVVVSGNIVVSAGGAFTVFQPLTPTGDITSGSNVITNVSSTAGIVAMWNISGTGLSGATVSLFDATTITISVAATLSGTAVPLSIKPTLTNTLSIGGDLTNNGKFDMSLGSSTTVCNVTFTKAGDQTVSGSGDTTRFRGIALSKTAKTNKVISSMNITIAGTSLFIPTGSTGTWEQTAGTITVSSSQTTGATTALNIIGSANWYQYVASNLTIAGEILVNTSGTVTIGNGSNKFDVATAGATAVLTAGTINVFGKVALSAGANITLNCADINVDPQDVTSLLASEYTFRITTGAGTAVNWTAGTIKIVDPNVNSVTGAIGDFVTTSVLNMSGTAKLVIGNGVGTSSNAFGGFRISSTATQMNLTLNTGTVGIVRLSDINVKTLTYTSSGAITGAFLFKYGTSGTLEYNGTTAQTTSDIEFPALANVPTNLTINNAAGVTLHAARSITGVLTLQSGLFDNSTNQITLVQPTGSVVNAGGTISQTPLPVELTGFWATSASKNVLLTWKTATEINNKGFELERYNPSGWQSIGFIDGAGTSNSPREYSFIDKNLAAGRYSYRLKQIDLDGKFIHSSPVEAVVGLTAEDFTLSQNYPNPFNPSTRLSFAVRSAEHVNVSVYNALGQNVATLFNGIAAPNQRYELTFDGSALSSGTYFYVLRSSVRNEVKKMMLTK
jgi:hypothetical protein